MDGIPHETVPFDWLGDGLPILILLLAAVWIVHRLRKRATSAAAATSLSRRGWKGFARRFGRGRSPA